MRIAIIIIEAIFVLIFLLMFIRKSKLIWGIGLLTVTSATLLDALFATFSHEGVLDALGFFFYVISGGLFAGAALWLWGVLLPNIRHLSGQPAASIQGNAYHDQDLIQPALAEHGIVYDRKMIFEQMVNRLGPDDILDIAFDLEIPENDFITANQPFTDLIGRLIRVAESAGKSGELAMAIERALTSFPSEKLPRLEKLTTESPPTIFRHYLLANYTEDQLQRLTEELGFIWENLAGNSKKSKTRNLLLLLTRRNQLESLIGLMKA